MPEFYWSSFARALPHAKKGKAVPIGERDPLPVQLYDPLGVGLPPLRGRTITVKRVVPGIVTGAAYADADAIGTLIEFPNLLTLNPYTNTYSGMLHSALYFDLDDEGLQVDLHLFGRRITDGTDNSAYAPTDADVRAYLGTVSFTAFFNLGANQVSVVTGIGLPLVSTSSSVFGQAVARGALNIAAENLPEFSLTVLAD